MGLDTSHDCWHGGYGNFSRWRNALAVAAGYTLETVPARWGFTNERVREIRWEALDEKNYYGEWDRIPEDPLTILLAHSDCEGVIHPEHGKLLAGRLGQLIPRLPEGLDERHCDWRDRTRRFVDGLRDAAAKCEDVDFH